MKENKVQRKKDQLSKEEDALKLEIILEETKNGVFGVFFVLLKNNNQSFPKQIAFLVIELFQLLSYTFDKALGNIWKSTIAIQYASEVLSTFRITYWLKKLSFDIYLIVFYVIIFLIFLIIIDFIYIIYSSKHKKFQFILPVQALRISCQVLVSFLYIPILELLMSFSQCSKIQDVLVLELFQSVKCFNSIHILHAVISYLIIIIFFIITTMMTLFFYEFRNSKDAFSRMHSKCQIFQQFSKVLYVFSFTFFNNEENYWFLSIVLFVFSSITFLKFVIDRPFYNNTTQKIINLFNGIFCWTSFVLMVSSIILSLDFSGNLPIYLLGLPFISLIVLNLKDNRKSNLLQSINTIEDGELIQKQITYFLSILDNKDQDRDAFLTLKGYVNYHSEFCTMEDCPLKGFKKQMIKDQKKLYGQFGQTNSHYISSKNQVTSLESHPLLILQAKNLYLKGIQRFPKFTCLKIDFAVFLLQKMHNKKEAMRELIQAEKNSTSYEEQFKIFRLKHIIETESHDGMDINGGGLDYVVAMNFENHFVGFRNAIEKSAFLHSEFWNLLIDDHPDIGKLSEQGTKINQSIHNVEDKWKKLTEQSAQTPKALRLYASYLIEIINDKEVGNEHLQKAKEAAVMRAYLDINNLQEDASDMSTYSNDGTPCIYISGEQEKVGVITQCNMSACKTFGYSRKEDLINHDLEILMPKIYAKNHKQFIEQALQRPPDLLSTRERTVFGKHISGYIFPISLQIKNLHSFLSGRQFVGIIKVEKSTVNKNVSYIIIDQNNEIIDISATCVQMLDISQQKLQKKAKFDISILLPHLYGANYYQFTAKTGCQIEYYFPELVDLSDNDKLRSTLQLSLKKSDSVKKGSEKQSEIRTNNQYEIDEMNEKATNSDGKHTSSKFNNNTNKNLFNEQEESSDFQTNPHNTQMGTQSIDEKQKKRKKQKNKKRNQQNNNNQDSDSSSSESETKAQQKQQFTQRVVASQTRPSINLHCYMNEIHFETQNLANASPGHYIKLETFQDKNAQPQKIPKGVKQQGFQFSYDSLYKRFVRELRDKDNKDHMLDMNFKYLKVRKEEQFQQQQLKQQQLADGIQIITNENDTHKIKAKIATMSYMKFLSKCQRLKEKGKPVSQIDEEISEDNSLSEHLSEGENENTQSKKINIEQESTNNNSNNNTKPILKVQQVIGKVADIDIESDFKKYIPGQGAGREYLKGEIDKMLDILRKKHEIGQGVHQFSRVDPAKKGKRDSSPAYQGETKYEEVQPQVANLFAQKSSSKLGFDEDEDGEGKEDEKTSEKSGQINVQSNIKSRKAFSMSINDKTMPSSILRLSRIAAFVLLSLISIAVVDYAVAYKQIQDTILNFETIEQSYLMVAEIHKVCFNIRTLIMLNNKTLTTYSGFSNSTQLFSYVQNDLQNSLKLLYAINTYIDQSQLSLSKPHFNILNMKTNNIYFKQDQGTMQTLQFTLIQAIMQMQSSIFTVSNMNLNQFVDDNEDVFFIIQNSFSDFYQSLIKSCNLYVTELNDRSIQRIEIFLILFILSIVSLCIISMIIAPVIKSINRQKDKVLSLFCEISETNIKLLLFRCEKFLAKLQEENNNGDGEMDSNDDIENFMALNGQGLQTDIKDNLEDDYGLLQTEGQAQANKRGKSNIKTQKVFYLKFFFAVLLIEAYYSYNYYTERDYVHTTQTFGTELNISSASEPFYWFALNSQRELYFNPSKQILYQDPFIISKNFIQSMYSINNDLTTVHLENANQLSQTYIQLFDQIMFNDTCFSVIQQNNSFFNTNATQFLNCTTFISGSTQQGMASVIVRFQENLKTLLFNYSSAILQNNWKSNTTIMKSLLNSNLLFEAYLIQHEFCSSLYRELVAQLKTSIVQSYNVLSQQRIFLLIFFLILLLLAYVAIWIPLVNNINNQIYKTKLMLMIIPLEILTKMKNVGKILQNNNLISEKFNNKQKKVKVKKDEPQQKKEIKKVQID